MNKVKYIIEGYCYEMHRMFKELRKGKKTYATAVGSIEHFDGDYDDAGFYLNETESWITVLCEKCGLAVHNFIGGQLQAKHLRYTIIDTEKSCVKV